MNRIVPIDILCLFSLLGLACFGCRLGGEEFPSAEAEVTAPSRPATDTAKEALDRAHGAYAAGNQRTMIAELGTVLSDPDADEAAQSNAIELLDAAFAETKGRVDTGFEIPKGMTWMRLLFQQADRDGTPAYLAMLNGGLADGVEIEEIRLVREHDQRVLASKREHVGYFETGKEATKPYFYIHSNDAASPMAPGAYRIEWTYADETSGSARVLVPSLRLDDLPEVIAPTSGQVVDSEQPTIRWQPPAWSSDIPYGKVILEVRVNCETGDCAARQRWSMWEEHPSMTEVTIGSRGEPEGWRLSPGGRYTAAVQYQWRLAYGELQLGTMTRTSRELSMRGR